MKRLTAVLSTFLTLALFTTVPALPQQGQRGMMVRPDSTPGRRMGMMQGPLMGPATMQDEMMPMMQAMCGGMMGGGMINMMQDMPMMHGRMMQQGGMQMNMPMRQNRQNQ